MDEIKSDITPSAIKEKSINIKSKYIGVKVPRLRDFGGKEFWINISVYGEEIGRYHTYLMHRGDLYLTNFFNDLIAMGKSVQVGDIVVIKPIEIFKEYKLDIIKPA